MTGGAHDATREARRLDVVVVAVVGSLSLVVSGLYLWAVQSTPGAAQALARPAVAYVGWGVVTVAQTALLWWHRTHPVPVFVSVFTLFGVGSVLIGDASSGASLPLWFAVFAVVAYARPRVSVPLVVAGWLVNAVLQLVLYDQAGLGTLSTEQMLLTAINRGLFYGACLALGFAVRLQVRRAADAAERARLIERGTRAEIAAAIAAERNRMARELHDLAAHQLVDVLVSARAARYSTAQGSEHDAVLADIVARTGEALDSVRSTVGALRDGAREPEPYEPVTTAARRIIRDAQETHGTRIDASIAGVDDLDPARAQTVISVLREAIANAVKHAPGSPVTVTIDRLVGVDGAGGEAVRLRVDNPVGTTTDAPAVDGSGYGLVGAGERARLLGGALGYGLDDHGHWVTTVTLPDRRRPEEAAQ